MHQLKNAIKNLREDLNTGYWDRQSWADLSIVLDAISRAKDSEEQTHLILTNKKPTRSDSSKTWRILSGEE